MDGSDRVFKWYSEVAPKAVEWLWFPFFARGKITVVQGDPGCGKSLFMMDTIARLTTGRAMLDGRRRDPINVIYQCSEDGCEDTIKPRLENAGAECNKVAFINEDIYRVTLDNEIIRKTIINVDAKLLIIDPFQAYLGESDLSSASRMRCVMRTLGTWASTFNCAVVLVGHLNKKVGQNELYRGLGSVDIMALARSVIQIEKSDVDPNIRYVKQVKNSLSSIGPTLGFNIDRSGRLKWISDCTTENQMDSFKVDDNPQEAMNGKCVTSALLLHKLLSTGPILAADILKEIMGHGISERTIKNAKKTMGVVSFRKNDQWYWKLPEAESQWQE